jgi:Ca2+/Na+ antiporter
MHLLAALPTGSGFYLIISAGVATYIASKAAVDALVGGGTPTAGRLAIGQWLPVAVLSIVAILINQPQIAVGVVFSTSVAVLTLATGATTFLEPAEGTLVSRRCWPMLLPAGILVFLVGFRGTVSGFDALVLLLQGLFVLLLWIDRPNKPVGPTTAMLVEPRRAVVPRILQFLLAVALAAVGGWLAVSGVQIAATTTEVGSAGLMTATILSPLLALPIIGTGSELAHRQQSPIAVSSQVGVALLNVFALLPLLVLLAYRHEMLWHLHSWFTPSEVVTLKSRPVVAPVFHSALILPLAVWRVDVVALIAVGFFLLPVAIGRWSLTKLQGLGMILGYAVYLAMSLLLVAMREV